MKIIGISKRHDWDNYEYICTISSEEIGALLAVNYREVMRVEVGTEIDVGKLADKLTEIQRTKRDLLTAPNTLRKLADALDRECIAIVPPPAETPKE